MNDFFSKRSLFLILIGAVLLVVLQVYSLVGTKRSVPLNQDGQEAHLVLDEGNGAKREFAGQVVSDMNILNAVLLSADAGNFGVDYQFVGETLVLKSINGKGGSGGQWMIYHNGRVLYGNELTAESVAPGDLISVVYRGEN